MLSPTIPLAESSFSTCTYPPVPSPTPSNISSDRPESNGDHDNDEILTATHSNTSLDRPESNGDNEIPTANETEVREGDITTPDISEDDELYEESDDDYGIPFDRPNSRRMYQYERDIEKEEDYEIGWEWRFEDTGPLVAPYSGFRQCLLDPTKNQPEDFFDALFEENMYTIIKEETNNYAHRKKQQSK